jgi:hypothetical protein
MPFEEKLHWVMTHIDQIEIQDFIDFISKNRNEFMVLHPARKKNEPNLGYFQSEPEMDQQTPFGIKLKAWIDLLPTKDAPAEELVAEFEEVISQRMPPARPAPPPPNLDDLGVRLQVKRSEAANDPIAPKHRWVKAEPSPGWD